MSEAPKNSGVPAPLVPPPGALIRPAHLLPAHVYASERNWPAYFDALGHLPARETLLRAITLFDAESPPDAARHALDLGCGDGRDTLELLARGWHVTAIDSSREGLHRLEARTPPDQRPRLTTLHSTFEELADQQTLTPPHPAAHSSAQVDLVNASFALSFCPPHSFAALWSRVRQAIKPGGRFAGQFFGPSDDWASLPDRSHHSDEQIRNDLLAGFDIEFWQEENRPTSNSDHPKHWHLFHVVAKVRR